MVQRIADYSLLRQYLNRTRMAVHMLDWSK